MRRALPWLASLLFLTLGVPSSSGAAGHTVAGTDRARLMPPAGARVEPYANDGYSLRFVEGGVEVQVELAPIQSRVAFAAPSRAAGDPIESIAYDATAGARNRYDAVSRILAWVARNVRYELDRGEPQDPVAVARRGTAYCTGTARLTVALLESVGIEAREVPGYVFDALPTGPRSGFHRWVEVWYPDRGWVFSDPLASHQFVPATYLRLAQETLIERPGTGALLARTDHSEEIDLALSAPDRIRVRPNDSERTSATLVVHLRDGAGGDEALLQARGGATRAIRLENGEGRFLGLATGSYELRVKSGGRLAAHKALVFRAPVLAEVWIPPARSERGVSGVMR